MYGLIYEQIYKGLKPNRDRSEKDAELTWATQEACHRMRYILSEIYTQAIAGWDITCAGLMSQRLWLVKCFWTVRFNFELFSSSRAY